ncbi:putative tRNA binding domain containing protein [Leishmania naiffi]|uniref:tRNA binding domain containing protein n=1 Tax=Leishmania naiffi TaxID=5678 RepID=A0AAW3BT65_9TRYP
MQFVIHSSSILAPALQHALRSILSVPASWVETSDKGPHRVTVDGKTFHGLQSFLQVLRRTTVTPEQKAFLGKDEEQILLVNQWVCAAAVLDVDATRTDADTSTLVAKVLYSDVERILAAMSNAASQYLTGSERATMADLLMYAAAFNHSAHAEVLPITMKWAAHAQEDAYLAPIRSAAVKMLVNNKAGKVSGVAAPASRAEVSYVKPSEEEILRRRAEKEKAKAEKAAAAAAGGASTEKASTGHSTGAASSNKAKKVELDSTSLYVRVGQLTNLRRHPDADRLYVEDMVLGDETRTIVSGLVEHYAMEELEGTQCLVVCNMKPKPLIGITSQGMVLCAKNGTEVKLIRPPAGAKPGDRILFGATYDTAVATAGAPEPMSGNKISEVLSHLHTNADGVLCWKDKPAKHQSGVEVCAPDMANCPVS